MIVDAHVHAFGEPGFWSKELFSVFQPTGVGLPDFVTPSRGLAKPMEQLPGKLDEAGIEKAFLLAHDLERPWKSRCPNEVVAAFVKRFPERFIGFASVDPLGGRKSVDELEHAVKDLHLHGLKLLPAYSGCAPGDRRAFPVYEAAQDLGIQGVTIHTGFATSTTQLAHDRPDTIDDVAIQFPKLRLIIAHLGLLWANDALMLLMRQANIFADISSWSLMPFDLLARTLSYAKHLGVLNKIMWGSDFPFLVTVSTQKQDIARLRKIPAYSSRIGVEPELTSDDVESVLGDNALNFAKTF